MATERHRTGEAPYSVSRRQFVAALAAAVLDLPGYCQEKPSGSAPDDVAMTEGITVAVKNFLRRNPKGLEAKGYEETQDQTCGVLCREVREALGIPLGAVTIFAKLAPRSLEGRQVFDVDLVYVPVGFAVSHPKMEAERDPVKEFRTLMAFTLRPDDPVASVANLKLPEAATLADTREQIERLKTTQAVAVFSYYYGPESGFVWGIRYNGSYAFNVLPEDGQFERVFKETPITVFEGAAKVSDRVLVHRQVVTGTTLVLRGSDGEKQAAASRVKAAWEDIKKAREDLSVCPAVEGRRVVLAGPGSSEYKGFVYTSLFDVDPKEYDRVLADARSRRLEIGRNGERGLARYFEGAASVVLASPNTKADSALKNLMTVCFQLGARRYAMDASAIHEPKAAAVEALGAKVGDVDFVPRFGKGGSELVLTLQTTAKPPKPLAEFRGTWDGRQLDSAEWVRPKNQERHPTLDWLTADGCLELAMRELREGKPGKNGLRFQYAGEIAFNNLAGERYKIYYDLKPSDTANPGETPLRNTSFCMGRDYSSIFPSKNRRSTLRTSRERLVLPRQSAGEHHPFFHVERNLSGVRIPNG